MKEHNKRTSLEAPRRSTQTSHEGFLCHNCGQPGHFRSNCPYEEKQFDKKFSGNPRFNSEASRRNDNKDCESSGNVSRNSECHAAPSFSGSRTENWIVDSGATQHMCRNKGSFFQLDVTHKGNIIVADGNRIPIMGKGSVRLTLVSGNDRWDVVLNDVLWVPELSDNLVSVNQLGRKGYTAVFTEESCHLSWKSFWFCIANHKNGLYMLMFQLSRGSSRRAAMHSRMASSPRSPESRRHQKDACRGNQN